jgi:hypothetical protein
MVEISRASMSLLSRMLSICASIMSRVSLVISVTPCVCVWFPFASRLPLYKYIRCPGSFLTDFLVFFWIFFSCCFSATSVRQYRSARFTAWH